MPDNLQPMDSTPNRSKPPVGPKGIPCPACGATESRVPNTHAHPGKLIRVRVCKACGRKYRTAERRA